MNQPKPHVVVTGAAMDNVVPKSLRKRNRTVFFALFFVLLAGLVYWKLMPHGLLVPAAEVRIAAVEKGVFLDRIVVRANILPRSSVILDSVESGRVEEVFIRDGETVKTGQLLFRLSNPQRRLELLARQSDHAQQISNLSNLRASLENARAEHRRRVTELEFELSQAEKAWVRNQSLMEKQFISSVVLDESRDRLAKVRRALNEENSSAKTEVATKLDGIVQMERVSQSLESGLKLMGQTIDALSVRASVAGRMTDFRLQVGETVKVDQHIGRIDDPLNIKVTAQIDEYYLNRMKVGNQGEVQIKDQVFALEASQIFPQIKEGRFTAEFDFRKGQPNDLRPGQTMDLNVTLGAPLPALLLPNGAFVNDTGGAWVFVVDADGKTVRRRNVKLGRRNPSQVEIVSGLSAGEKVLVSGYSGFGKAQQLQLGN